MGVGRHFGTADDCWMEVFQFSGRNTCFTYAGPRATDAATLWLEACDG